MKWYQRNLQLLQKSKEMTKEQHTKMINAQVPKMGLKNKYDNFI